MLDLSEEDAIKQFEALLNDTSYLTVVFDRIHDWFVKSPHPMLTRAGRNIYETKTRWIVTLLDTVVIMHIVKQMQVHRHEQFMIRHYRHDMNEYGGDDGVCDM